MNEALKELELLISLTSTLEHQTYLNNKLKLIKNLLENDSSNSNSINN